MTRTLTVFALVAALLGVQSAFAAVDSPSCLLGQEEMARIWGGQDTDKHGEQVMLLASKCEQNRSGNCTAVSISPNCINAADAATCVANHCWKCNAEGAYLQCEPSGPGCNKNGTTPSTCGGSLLSMACIWGGVGQCHCPAAGDPGWGAAGPACTRSDCF